MITCVRYADNRKKTDLKRYEKKKIERRNKRKLFYAAEKEESGGFRKIWRECENIMHRKSEMGGKGNADVGYMQELAVRCEKKMKELNKEVR